MKKADFIALKDYIIGKNEYFTAGFANAFSVDDGGVYVSDNMGYKCVMPNDALGNYFYLKNANDITHNKAADISDCGTNKAYNDIINVTLIAIVNDADEFELINALRNTVISYPDMTIVPFKTSFNRESVVIAEMRGAEKEEIQYALQRLKNETIVRLELRVTKQYFASNCVINPCETC